MPLSRIRFDRLGTATEQDLLDLTAREDWLFELVDGVLIAKTIGFRESVLTAAIVRYLGNFVFPRRLGILTGPDGAMRLAPGLIRTPDVAFVPWDRFPNRQVPRTPIPDVAPDLAVEVLSPSNTKTEMKHKLRDYFAAECCLVWLVHPEARTVAVYTTSDQFTLLHESETLDGGSVLPGFTLPLRDLFAIFNPH